MQIIFHLAESNSRSIISDYYFDALKRLLAEILRG